uniref:Corticoliberin-1 n=1 Tax=Oryzias latipes TaxID=8090 RepID=A0A3P9LAN7_ORYLA
MKVKVLFLAVLLGIVPSHTAEGRPSVDPLRRTKPLLLRLGEEFSFWLGGGGTAPDPSSPSSSSSSSSSTLNRALLQLSQHLLQTRAEQEEQQQLEEDGEEKEKRSEEPSISLDLTFHLLREVLEMARAEKMVQQADNNRRMMELFGK